MKRTYNKNNIGSLLKVNPSFTLFWGAEDWGSNFHPSHIKFENYELTCSEQLFMLLKARHFESPEAELKIAKLRNVHPNVYRRIGRELPNWSKFGESWELSRDEIMMTTLRLKFTQNEKLKQALLDTGNSIIVEASPYDKYWGVGLAAHNPMIKQVNKWRGQNKLGFLLMELRDELKGDK